MCWKFSANRRTALTFEVLHNVYQNVPLSAVGTYAVHRLARSGPLALQEFVSAGLLFQTPGLLLQSPSWLKKEPCTQTQPFLLPSVFSLLPKRFCALVSSNFRYTMQA